MSDLGRIIKWNRRRLGLSQADLSERSGISVGVIQSLEQEERDTCRHVHKLAIPLGLPKEVLEDAMGLDSSLRSWLKGQPEAIRFLRQLRRGKAVIP